MIGIIEKMEIPPATDRFVAPGHLIWVLNNTTPAKKM